MAAIPDFLVVARANNYGLTRDSRILVEAIRSAGRSCGQAARRDRGLLESVLGRKRAGTIIHVERVHRRWLSAGDAHWLVPNQERFPRRQTGLLKHIDRVLAKTRHAEQIFSRLGADALLIGFTSEDRNDASIPRDWDRFFHLAGANTLKGTEDILELWAAHPDWPELVLAQKKENAPASVPPNVRLVAGYLDDADLRALQNGCGVHLCPSRSEGWGHHIVEALSVGALVVTTDAPPMNELVTPDIGVMATYSRAEPRHLGTNYFVDRIALEAAVERVIALPVDEKARLGAAARDRYKAIDRAFREGVRRLVEDRSK